MTTPSSSRAAEKHGRRYPAAELRAWAPFVRKDAIKAGDILLSRGRGAESWAIALSTRGRYSHAAFFLPFRFDKVVEHKGVEVPLKGVFLDVVEADDEGVGAVPARPLTIASGGRKYDVLRFADGRAATVAVLLRHPAMASVDERMLEQTARIFSDTELLRSYSSMERLAGPLRLPGLLKRVFERALRARYPQPEGPILPGCFCSELAAKFYNRLGVPLFSKAIIAENISPNDLVPSRSLLKVVPDAIVTAADIADDATGETITELLQDELRARFLPRLVWIKAFQERGYDEETKRIESINAFVKQKDDERRKRDDQLRGTQATFVHQRIVDARSDETILPLVRRMLDSLLNRSTYLVVLRDHLRSEQVPRQAGAELRRIHDRAFIDLALGFTRATTLTTMARARQLPAEIGRKVRMRAIADWREQKQRCTTARADLSGPAPRQPDWDGEADGVDTDAWIKKVLEELSDKARAARYADHARDAAQGLI